MDTPATNMICAARRIRLNCIKLHPRLLPLRVPVEAANAMQKFRNGAFAGRGVPALTANSRRCPSIGMEWSWGRHRVRLRVGLHEGVIQGGRIMTLQIEPEAHARLVTHDKNACPRCQAWLLAPNWSEYLDARCVRHTWSCEACGYEFETAVFFSAAEAVAA
jgi:hypothetical protein